ncbi:Putative glucose-6-phosphate 1-epimerase [Bordetella ansorpii]|uniref:Putative glucose-6-phosphate 1-epimerase n=1 Tax=Bordetella ansorpii TaxID=288768 RepID=A0A157MTG0_9BORD|nr:D-hexose-6-phosphate mutarotase [Bordetella ansorpii]SAI12321.1 Putative glucose-6-phosphate 1-epimerase [Bordetella ansorpii]
MTTPAPVRIFPERLGELDCLRIETPHGSALMAPQGAQLLSYTPTGGKPLVWLSEQASFRAGASVRGGVPVCWPWFGVYARNPQSVRDSVNAPDDAPSHGLVRGLDWQLAEPETGKDWAELMFVLDLEDGLGPWRHSARLALTARFGKSLELGFSITNTGSAPFTVSLALHTYLAVSDSRRVRIDGLQDKPYLDTARGWTPLRQQGEIAIEEETDRIYQEVDRPIEVHDPDWGRTLRLAASNSRSAVVWNPWVEKSARLSDFASDAWQRMLCIETARIMDDVLTVEAGATETVALAIQADTGD